MKTTVLRLLLNQLLQTSFLQVRLEHIKKQEEWALYTKMATTTGISNIWLSEHLQDNYKSAYYHL